MESRIKIYHLRKVAKAEQKMTLKGFVALRYASAG